MITVPDTFQGLERTIEKALDSVNVEIRKYFRKAREYHRAYRNNIEIGKEMLIMSTLSYYSCM